MVDVIPAGSVQTDKALSGSVPECHREGGHAQNDADLGSTDH